MPRQRKNITRHKENPFLEHTAAVTKTGYKPVYTSADGTIQVYNDITGEVSGAAIAVRKEVDKAQFVKLYAEGVAALLNLRSAGKKVFALIYAEISSGENVNATQIMLNYDMLTDKEQQFISRTTFFRGIRQCLEANIIAQTLLPGFYFVNPAFIFNGNRLTIVKEFIIKKKAESEMKNITK